MKPIVNRGSGLSAAAYAVLWVVALAGCSRQEKKAGPPPPAPVVTAPAEVKDVPILLKAIGTVEPSLSVAVRARVGGELIRVNLRQGADVRAGDLLMMIDPQPYQAALRGALADAARDSARSAAAEADRARYADLIDKEYITRQQYDQAVAAAAAAVATLDADRAAVENARLNLGYCAIRTPISGRAGDVLVQQGNLVKPNDVPLVVINQIEPVYVGFSVPGKYLTDIRRYSGSGTLPVTASLPDAPDSSFDGTLTFVNNAVDEASGTILLKATFLNRDHALWPGQFVEAAVRLTVRTGAVVVPAAAVQTGQQGDYVFLIKSDNTALLQPVVLGPTTNGGVVVEKGVQAGDVVVTDGQLRLVPGARVAARTAGSPEAAARR